MRYLIVLLFVMTGQAWGETLDIIDIQSSCKAIRDGFVDERPAHQSNCSQNVQSEHLTNYDHHLVVDSIDTETKLSVKSKVIMDESDLTNICERFEKAKQSDSDLKAISFDIPTKDTKDKKKRKWKIIFTFGPFLAFHHKMDMKIKNGDTDAIIKGIKPIQRTSMHHYNIFSGRTKPGQFLDEPQNRITLELVNDKMFLGLEYSHPKILFQDEWDTPENNQEVDIEGTIGNEEVNVQGVPLKNYIYQIQASHGNTNINAFAGKNFNLAGKKDGNNLQLQVGGGAGVSFANGVTKYYHTDANGDKTLKITKNAGMKIYGYNVAGKVRLRHNFLKGRMNATLKYDGVYTRINGQLGGLHAEGNLFSHQVGVAVGLKLDGLFKKKCKKKKCKK